MALVEDLRGYEFTNSVASTIRRRNRSLIIETETLYYLSSVLVIMTCSPFKESRISILIICQELFISSSKSCHIFVLHWNLLFLVEDLDFSESNERLPLLFEQIKENEIVGRTVIL